jgi:hypothetical protein
VPGRRSRDDGRAQRGQWLSRHPFPERRVEAVVKACEEALARPLR